MNKYLLDTHAILWFLEGNEKLPEKLRDFIIQQREEIIVSSISLWEISIKLSINKLPTVLTINNFVEETARFWNVKKDINIQEIILYRNLPLYHRDPFDRMLIAQAQAENLTIITKDQNFSEYDIEILW